MLLLLLQIIYFRSSSIDVIIVICGPLIMNASLALEDFFGGFRISSIIKAEGATGGVL